MGTLEALYGGRLLWGFGKGGRSEIAHTHCKAVTAENAREKMRHSVQKLLQLRDTETIVPGLRSDTPWFIASRDVETIRFAAQHGMGLMHGHKWPLETLAESIRLYREAHPLGKKPEVMMSRYFLCANDTSQARLEATEALKARRNLMRLHGRASGEEGVIPDFDASLVGMPAHCARRLADFESAGVTHLSLRPLQPCGDAVIASLKQLGL